MDYFKLQVIRSSLLRDLKEFVPKDHYSIETCYGAQQGGADFDIGRMFFLSNSAMTARQVSASNALMKAGLYSMADGEIAGCQADRLKLTYENPELEADYRKLLSDKKQIELELRVLVEQYAQHLPDNEAKAILFLIKDDIAQRQTETETKNQHAITKWMRETWINEGRPGATAFFNVLKKYVNVKGSPIVEHYIASQSGAGIRFNIGKKTTPLTKKAIQNKVGEFKKEPQ